MKQLFTAVIFFTSIEAYAQWQGTNPVYFNAGNVGIGSSSPQSILHLNSTVDARKTFRIYWNNDLTKYLNFFQGTGGAAIDPIGTGLLYLGYDQSTDVIIGNNGGKLGIGVAAANSALSVKGRFGIRADAAPTTPTETMRVEGAISTEENVVNVTNLADQDFVVRLSGAGAGTKRTIIGTSTTNRFSLGVGVSSSNEYLTLVNGGNVGIGTTSPSQKLDVSGDVKIASRLYFGTANAYNGGSYGVIGLQTGIPGKNIVFYNYDGPVNELMTLNGTTGTASINNGGLIVSGNVGIGTTNPDYPLTVNGSIHAKEVRVDLSVPGPDYVFANDYKLPSLEDIKNYIDENKHLPEVPSAAAMEKNGVQLGEMNMLLLKKIEELTLYVIEQDKKVDELKKENDEQNKQIKELKRQK